MRSKRISSTLALAAILSACAPAPLLYPPGATPAGTTSLAIPTSGDYIAGATWMDAKLNGATVTLLDAGGKTLREFPGASNENGAFALALTEALPARFRLVVANGSDKLMADFENFNPDTDTAFVTPLTTVASKFIDAKPGTKPADAEAAVERYMGLLKSEHLGYETAPGATSTFDLAAFMTAAKAEGGFDAFTTKLAGELGSDKTRAFVPAVTKDPALAEKEPFKIFGKTPDQIGTDIFKAGLSYAGGQTVTYALKLMGYKDTAEKGHEAVLADIAKQKEMLEGIQKDVQVLGAQVKAASREIQDALTRANYESISVRSDDYMGIINSAYNRLTYYVQAGPRDQAELMAVTADWRRYVKNTIPDQVDGLHLQLMDEGSKRGLITMWHEAVIGRTNAGKLKTLVGNDYLIPVNEHFSYYYGHEIKGLMTVMEVLHFEGDAQMNESVQRTIDRFQSKFKAQLAHRGYRVLGKSAEEGIRVDRVNKLLWARHPLAVYYAPTSRYESLVSYNGGNGTFSGGPSLAVTPQAFINRDAALVGDAGKTGAAFFQSGWRLPTAPEMFELGERTRMTGDLLKAGGMWPASAARRILTSTVDPQNKGYTNWAMLDLQTGDTSPAQGISLVQAFAVRPIVDFDEVNP